MKHKQNVIKQRVIFLSIFIILTEVLNELENIFLPTQKTLVFILHLIFSASIIFFLFLLLKDIHQTTTELRKSNEKLKNIFDTLDVAIWYHDLKANVLLITPGIEKLYRWSLEQLSGS